MKLHLGCGDIHLSGYVNVDIVTDAAADVIADLRVLPLALSTAAQVYSCAVLEHFGRNQWKDVLKHWFDVLEPGGLLRISTNDFDAARQRYAEEENLEELLGLLIGGQKTEYDWHGMIFDFPTLSAGLEEAGFVDVRCYDWCRTFVGREGIDDYSQAYLPHMDKENGRLMMLNVEANRPT